MGHIIDGNEIMRSRWSKNLKYLWTTFVHASFGKLCSNFTRFPRLDRTVDSTCAGLLSSTPRPHLPGGRNSGRLLVHRCMLSLLGSDPDSAFLHCNVRQKEVLPGFHNGQFANSATLCDRIFLATYIKLFFDWLATVNSEWKISQPGINYTISDGLCIVCRLGRFAVVLILLPLLSLSWSPFAAWRAATRTSRGRCRRCTWTTASRTSGTRFNQKYLIYFDTSS